VNFLHSNLRRCGARVTGAVKDGGGGRLAQRWIGFLRLRALPLSPAERDDLRCGVDRFHRPRLAERPKRAHVCRAIRPLRLAMATVALCLELLVLDLVVERD
jgi:hypothetical protein